LRKNRPPADLPAGVGLQLFCRSLPQLWLGDCRRHGDDQPGDVAVARDKLEEDEAGGQTSAAPERASRTHEEAQGESEEVRTRVAAIAAGTACLDEGSEPAGRLSADAAATADLLVGV